MIVRDLAPVLRKAARTWPSITLTGPRQSGKTTLCRGLFPHLGYESLEAPDTRLFATEDPRRFLGQFPQGAILDEIQQVPDLLSYLMGIIDENPAPGRWILTGSQNFSLLRTASQSLAGRTAIHHLLPLTRGEIQRFAEYPETLEEALFVGSYPRIYQERMDPAEWMRSYVATYVERDARDVINPSHVLAFQKFLMHCAARTAQLLNLSSLAGDCGISQPTAKNWLGALEIGFLASRLPTCQRNLRKRLVKLPKLHFHDTGLVCWLLGIRNAEQLRAHPLRGAIFETWVVSEMAKRQANLGDSGCLWFYRDKNGAEVDLIVERPTGSPVLIEAKSAETASSSFFAGLRRVGGHLADTLGRLPSVVVYGGDRTQRRDGETLLSWRDLPIFDWESLTA